MKKPLIIKKYKNRRLYDTERSVFLTRDQLLEIVRSGRDVRIEDVDGVDATNEVLLQIMIESGTEGHSAKIPSDFIHFLLRANDQALDKFFQGFLPAAMQDFLKTQQSMAAEMVKGFSKLNPFAAAFQVFLEPTKDQSADSPSGEVEELRQQLAQMQSTLDRLMGKK